MRSGLLVAALGWRQALAVGAMVCMSMSAGAQITPVGGIARDFHIVNHNTGQPLNLHDYQGSVILLDFFAYWCGWCGVSAPDVETNIVQYYQARGGE